MSALQILCVLIVVTILFSPCDLKFPGFTKESLLKNCVSGGSLYCDFWKKDFGKPDLDYRYFYGPAETQTYYDWDLWWHKRECPNGGWAWAATGVLEGIYYWKINRTLVSFSKKKLIKCVYSRNICEFGGDIRDALEYIQDEGIYESKYYEMHYFPWRCRPNEFVQMFYTQPGQVYFKNAFDVRTVDEHANASEIIELLKKYGPISVGVSVRENFKRHHFQDGLLSNDYVRDDESINHFVVLVGYGETWYDNQTYWIIRNSYGPDWGRNGYALLRRTESGYEVNRFAHYIVLRKTQF